MKLQHGRKRERVDRRGLTGLSLIELLVVVGVIAVLASLLLPAMSGAKARAYSISCRSNLRQLGIQLALYVSDQNVYPSAREATTNLVGTAKGPSGESGIRRCPTRTYRNATTIGGTVWFSGETSYGYNEEGYVEGNTASNQYRGLGLAGAEVNGLYRPRGEAEVRVPSEMLSLGDNLALLPGSNGGMPMDRVIESVTHLARDERLQASGSDVMGAVKRASARHMARGNVLFCDGHVEGLSFKSLFLSRDDASLSRWNYDHEPH